MKKLFLTLALVLGVSIANAQFFIGGQFGITHDDAKDNKLLRLLPNLVMPLMICGPLPV